jgi:hypothetical protein
VSGDSKNKKSSLLFTLYKILFSFCVWYLLVQNLRSLKLSGITSKILISAASPLTLNTKIMHHTKFSNIFLIRTKLRMLSSNASLCTAVKQETKCIFCPVVIRLFLIHVLKHTFSEFQIVISRIPKSEAGTAAILALLMLGIVQ